MVPPIIHTAYSAAVDEHDDDHARHRYVSAKHGNRQQASDDWNADGAQTSASSSTTSNIDPRERLLRENISLPPFIHFSRVEYPGSPMVHHRSYELLVAQQPQTTAECGQNDMSRLPLSPPLFVRLVVRNSVGAEISADAELPFLVARITLHSAESPLDQSSSAELYGTTISGPHSLRDLEGVPGAYFVFPDVGVRHQGQWRLWVSLLRIARFGSATVFGDGDTSSSLAGVWTDIFDVVSAEGYVAPERTPLTRHFQSQGVRMYISSSVVPR